MVKTVLKLIPVLQQMPMALVTALETDPIAGPQPPHESGKGNFIFSLKKVSMLCEAQDYVK